MKTLNLPVQKKILVVAESIDVEDSSGTKGRVALIKNLHKIGFDVRVYHYTRKEIQLPGINCIVIKEKRWSVLFFLSRLERHIRFLFKIQLSNTLEKVFGFSFTLFNDRNSIVAALRKIDDFNPDFVLTLSQGGRFRPHHAVLKMPELHEKWIAYMHDPYPMHLYPRPFAWVEPGYHEKWKLIWDISEKAAYSAFPSKLLQDWMGSYFPPFMKTGVIIPHQIIDLFTEDVHLPDYFNPNLFNILHSGTLLQPRNPTKLVLAFQIFLNINPEAKEHSKLILIGGESIYSSWLKLKAREIEELKLSNGKLPFREVFKMQQHAAVNIILEAKAEISPFLPGKFPHCVQADKPILLLGPHYSESRRLLGNNYPYWSEIDDLEKITENITDLYRKWKKSPSNFNLDRPELLEYMSSSYLGVTINKL